MGQNDDDIFSERQCPGELWEYIHFDVFFAEKGTIALGVSRLISFIFIVSLNLYNQYLLRKKAQQENVTKVTGLILPYYLLYIKIYVGFSLAVGVIDFVVHITHNEIHGLIPVEVALFHWLGEGLAFFLMRYGAGVTAIKRALTYSFLWAIIVFVLFFAILGTLEGKFGIKRNPDIGYGIFVAFSVIMIIFYGANIVLPATVLYRRSALIFYSGFCCLYYFSQLFFATVLYKDIQNIICACSIIDFIGVAFIQPLVIYRTLQIDSEYWQGLSPEKGNPLAEVWDHVDVETAQTMADNVEQINRSSNKLPILHFGLLNFDSGDTFVAGGFSRVYFGNVRGKRAAFKILFAMELTPADVREFYREANLLFSLSHENIVICRGICVMPPALTIVLEHCKYGSLFDFLYKPMKEFIAVDHRLDHMQGELSLSGFDSDIINPLANATSSNNIKSDKTGPNEDHEHNENNDKTRTTAVKHTSKPIVRQSLVRGDHTSVTFNLPVTNTYSSNRLSQFSIEDTDRDSRTFRQSTTVIRRTIDSLAAFLQPTQPNGKITHSMNINSYSNSKLLPVFTAAKAVSYATRLMMMRDAVSGIAFLHSKGFMHCDIKSLNFLVDENFRVKLADLGEARPIKGPAKSHLPPIPARNWAPPEVLKKGATADSYNIKSDVYGMSIVLIELLTLDLPYGDECDRMTAEEWHHKLVNEQYQVQIPEQLNVPRILREIIHQGIKVDPFERPSAEGIRSILELVISSFDSNDNNSHDVNDSSYNSSSRYTGTGKDEDSLKTSTISIVDRSTASTHTVSTTNSIVSSSQNIRFSSNPNGNNVVESSNDSIIEDENVSI